MGRPQPKQENVDKMWTYFRKFCEKSGTTGHPDQEITENVVLGLAANIEEVGRPLCPCNFYTDKKAEVTKREWICACDEMQIYKYCHCFFFVNKEGMPITEYLPEWHEGRRSYGVVPDPTPDKGRALKHKAEEWEKTHRPEDAPAS